MSEAHAVDAAAQLQRVMVNKRATRRQWPVNKGNGHVVMRKKPSQKRKKNTKSIRSASGAQSPRSRTPKKRTKPNAQNKAQVEVEN
jgi:hypothetical protein